jgi:hypothetical protein
LNRFKIILGVENSLLKIFSGMILVIVLVGIQRGRMFQYRFLWDFNLVFSPVSLTSCFNPIGVAFPAPYNNPEIQ